MLIHIILLRSIKYHEKIFYIYIYIFSRRRNQTNKAIDLSKHDQIHLLPLPAILSIVPTYYGVVRYKQNVNKTPPSSPIKQRLCADHEYKRASKRIPEYKLIRFYHHHRAIYREIFLNFARYKIEEQRINLLFNPYLRLVSNLVDKGGEGRRRRKAEAGKFLVDKGWEGRNLLWWE